MFLSTIIENVRQNLAGLLDPGSFYSVPALFSTLVITLAFYIFKKPRKGMPRLRAWRRLLLPSKFMKSRSVKADVYYYFLNSLVTGTLIGWGLISGAQVSQVVSEFLNSHVGAHESLVINGFAAHVVITVCLFLAHDFSYWLDHYLKHSIPALWPFHRVHHTAELLTPITNFRMHPVDTLIFTNIQVLFIGATNGIMLNLFGDNVSYFNLGVINVILALFYVTIINLQHSHVPIRFTGIWGRIFFSPVHHHIHHSSDPAHYGRNLGSFLAIWDWMFGTLLTPEQVSAPLKFGAESEGEDAHSAVGGLLFPFVQVLNLMKPDRSGEAQATSPLY